MRFPLWDYWTVFVTLLHLSWFTLAYTHVRTGITTFAVRTSDGYTPLSLSWQLWRWFRAFIWAFGEEIKKARGEREGHCETTFPMLAFAALALFWLRRCAPTWCLCVTSETACQWSQTVTPNEAVADVKKNFARNSLSNAYKCYVDCGGGGGISFWLKKIPVRLRVLRRISTKAYVAC